MIAFLLGLAGPLIRIFSPTSKLFHLLGKLSDNPVELERIRAEAATKLIEARAAVIQTGMAHRMFWVAWSIAAIPTTSWYGWGMLDSMIYAGTVLPDVAALPAQLKGYADSVWNNLFISGGGVVAATTLAKSLSKR